ncbi:hypothetical protein PENSPDRAFT_637553 [Peniophora sp. CONT]|nr:hypothetical protein PENSPDRAFT_637553 [Peniophora sp. CONT]
MAPSEATKSFYTEDSPEPGDPIENLALTLSRLSTHSTDDSTSPNDVSEGDRDRDAVQQGQPAKSMSNFPSMTGHFLRNKYNDDTDSFCLRAGIDRHAFNKLYRLDILLRHDLVSVCARTRALSDFDRAIECMQEMLDLVPEENVVKASLLEMHAWILVERSLVSRDLDDLDLALASQFCASTIDTGFLKPLHLVRLGLVYWHRYELIGDNDELEACTSSYEEAAGLCQGDLDIHQVAALSLYADILFTKHRHLGRLEDLNKAISMARRALEHSFEDATSRATCLFRLHAALRARYEHLGDVTDLTAAITAIEHAVDLTSSDGQYKMNWLAQLGDSFRARFRLYHDRADIDASVKFCRQALELATTSDGHTAEVLSLLGNAYAQRSLSYQVLIDIEAAIVAHRAAVQTAPEGDRDRYGYLANLAQSLSFRYKLTRDSADLDEAICLRKSVMAALPETHIFKSVMLTELAHELLDKSSGNPSLLHEAILAYRQAAENVYSPASVRFMAAQNWARLALMHMSADASILAWKCGMALISRVVWLGDAIHRRYIELPVVTAFVNTAVAVAISEDYFALAAEWFEEGRCIVWAQIHQLRSPVDELRSSSEAGRKLADELERVSGELDRAGLQLPTATSMSIDIFKFDGREERLQNRHSLTLRYDELLEQARRIPGFSDFLRPKRLAALREAARLSPVVLLYVFEGGDGHAIVILGPQHAAPYISISLPKLSAALAVKLRSVFLRVVTTAGVRSRGVLTAGSGGDNDEMLRVLRTLWSHVVGPVVLELLKRNTLRSPYETGMIPRLTWCPSGALSFLPLHAAGMYDSSIQDFSNAMKIVASSYTPSLAALLNAHRATRPPDPQLLVVSQPATPHQSRLPATLEEARQAIEVLGQDRTDWLNDSAATKSAVLDVIGTHGWVHLACHAVQAKDPMQSAFYLHDGTLTLADIMQRSFTHTDLAILSACQTAAGDEALSDEVVHLAAGVLGAGFRGTIATMWSISDADAPVVMKEMYEHLARGGLKAEDAANALHLAVTHLRDKVGERAFLRWIPYVHFGL